MKTTNTKLWYVTCTKKDYETLKEELRIFSYCVDHGQFETGNGYKFHGFGFRLKRNAIRFAMDYSVWLTAFLNDGGVHKLDLLFPL